MYDVYVRHCSTRLSEINEIKATFQGQSWKSLIEEGIEGMDGGTGTHLFLDYAEVSTSEKGKGLEPSQKNIEEHVP